MVTEEFKPIFIESAPARLEPGLLYISMKYHTVLHLCPCGCGEEIVTPLAPDQWQLSFDGISITLAPSIGNYRLPCRSHYFIRKNRIERVDDNQRKKGHRKSTMKKLRSNKFWKKILKNFRQE